MEDHEVELQELSHSRYRICYPAEGVVVVADRVRDIHDGIKAELTVYDLTGRQLYFASVNLLSSSWRKSVAAACAERLPASWTDIVDDVCTRVVRAYRTPRAPQRLSEVRQQADQYLLWPLLLRDAPVILYADGGAGKSLLALALAIQVATGRTVVPGTRLEVAPTGVLYLDWEDTETIHAARMAKLCNGLGIPMPENLWHLRMHAPLRDCVDEVEAFIREHQVGLVDVDSLALAAGADPWAAEPILEVYRALRQLGCASLVVAHISKSDLAGRDRRPYGSVFARNAARSAWELQQVATSDGQMGLILRHTKSNWGPRHRPLAMRVIFDDPGNTIRVKQATVSELAQEGEADQLDRREVIIDFIRSRGQVTVKDVAALIGCSESAAKNLLHRMRQQGVLFSVLEDGTTRWMLAARRRHIEEAAPDWL
ncbi:MAG: crosslink repair DNA glycosylase YcaQ family protein [Armatimonadota bacterium]|nr:crosslink repair DNA glycosylase YcaQ family protein [Armatimonadota bacterium]